MRKIGKNMILLLVFLAGVSMLLYPTVSSKINEANQSSVIADYRKTVGSTSAETIARAKASAEEFNGLLFQESQGKFGEISQSLDARYWNELNLEGVGIMGYVNIPVIGETLPIEHGTSNETLLKAAGHLECTSLPVGGATTHTVLSGHRGLPSSVLFSNLDEVETGDVVYLHVLQDTAAYQVDSIETVLPEETESLATVAGEDRITLVTCTPYGVNTHRLLVHGHRVPYVAATEKATPVKGAVSGVFWVTLGLVLGGVMLAALFVVLIPRHYRRKLGNSHET